MQDTAPALFILVHDAWHGAWAWDTVIKRLAERGWPAAALDLPGHGSNTAGPPVFSLELYAQAVTDFALTQLEQTGAGRVILVGHGTAGPVIQLAARQLGSKLGGLVFVAAYVLKPGESIAGQMPPEMVDFFKSIAAARPDNRIDLTMLEDYWRYNVINDEPARAAELLARLEPEPAAPLFEAVRLERTQPESIVPGYIAFREDLSLPNGEFHPRMANKLGRYHLTVINAGHMGIITKPREVAEALVFIASQK